MKIFSGKIFVIFIFSMSVFIRPEKIFSQLIPMPVTLEMMGETLEKYAYDFAGAMGFASSIGLSWSIPYMGQLVDMPPHWGLGLAVGTTTLKFDNLNRISEGIFGMRLNSDIMGKQFLSYYALEGRIGGFQNMPFDIGVKWGWLPSIPLADSFSLESLEYGADIRFALSQDWGYFPGVFLGIELDRTSGGISHDSAELIDKAIQTNGATSAMFYEAWVIDAKVGVAKTFYQPAITIFAGVKVGVSIAKAGYSITGDDIGVDITNAGSSFTPLNSLDGDGLDAATNALTELQGKGKFTLSDKSIICNIDSIGIDFNTYEGISINFDNKTYLQFTLLFDFAHFEYGGSISFRYQQ